PNALYSGGCSTAETQALSSRQPSPGNAGGLPSDELQSVSTLKKVKREAAAQRRPARSERKNRAFSAKRQAVWFGMRSISN
ncbi:MAG TPA: hypothetical protein H9857_01735, partial [Candidatus Desulfovibrio intestinigallinarum]|nr:hypothetical protein [Candidatus Desulfovibrio intestinigallinarum]